jgi:hypothetical protein
LIDPDDIYKKGMFSEWLDGNAPITAEYFELGDLRIRLVKYSPQPLPPPPVIQGTVVNGHPRLTWGAVSGADYYEVTLNDTYESQVLTWNVYTTNFEDYDRYPVFLSSVQFPSLKYSVKTVDGSLKSNPSNTITYQYQL